MSRGRINTNRRMPTLSSYYSFVGVREGRISEQIFPITFQVVGGTVSFFSARADFWREKASKDGKSISEYIKSRIEDGFKGNSERNPSRRLRDAGESFVVNETVHGCILTKWHERRIVGIEIGDTITD